MRARTAKTRGRKADKVNRFAKRTAALDAVFGRPGVIVGIVIREARTSDGSPYRELIKGLRIVPFGYSRSFGYLIGVARKLSAHFCDKGQK